MTAQGASFHTRDIKAEAIGTALDRLHSVSLRVTQALSNRAWYGESASPASCLASTQWARPQCPSKDAAQTLKTVIKEQPTEK